MIHNDRFYVCLGLSLAIHTLFFIPFSLMAVGVPHESKPIEVFYEQTKKQVALIPSHEYMDQQKKSGAPLKIEKALSANTQTIRDFIKKEIFKEKEGSKAIIEKPWKADENASLKVSINLPDVPGESYKTPEYKSYYQIIREKIRKYAYYYYKEIQEGEVFLTFSINSGGELIEAAVNQKKSTSDEYLKAIALKSVKEASPYPKFPEKLKNKNKLSFNVIISFELK